MLELELVIIFFVVLVHVGNELHGGGFGEVEAFGGGFAGEGGVVRANLRVDGGRVGTGALQAVEDWEPVWAYSGDRVTTLAITYVVVKAISLVPGSRYVIG